MSDKPTYEELVADNERLKKELAERNRVARRAVASDCAPKSRSLDNST